jgi:hypothetical protein
VNESPDCTVCSRQLWEDEIGRFACRPCQRRTGDDLAAIAGPGGLYARLCLRIEPGARNGGESVSGSRSPSIPASMQILDLTAAGGIIGTLEEWVEEWAGRGLATIGVGGRLQYRIDRAVATLRLNLPQAVIRHEAFAAFASDIDRTRRTCSALIDGSPTPVRAPATCLSCSRPFTFHLFGGGADCPHCNQPHTRAQLLQPGRAA